MANIKITYDISRYIKYIFMYTFNNVLIKLHVCLCVTCVSACVILIVYTGCGSGGRAGQPLIRRSVV